MLYRIMSFCMGSVSVVGHYSFTYNEMYPGMLSCSFVLRYYITYPVLNYCPFKLSLWTDLIG